MLTFKHHNPEDIKQIVREELRKRHTSYRPSGTGYKNKEAVIFNSRTVTASYTSYIAISCVIAFVQLCCDILRVVQPRQRQLNIEARGGKGLHAARPSCK